MDIFPEDHEFIEFFEAEPTFADDDPSIAWVYKQLFFVFNNGGDTVRFEFDNPAVQVTYLRDEKVVFDVHLEDADELRISNEGFGTVLIACSKSTALELQLRPTVRLAIRSDSR